MKKCDYGKDEVAKCIPHCHIEQHNLKAAFWRLRRLSRIGAVRLKELWKKTPKTMGKK